MTQSKKLLFNQQTCKMIFILPANSSYIISAIGCIPQSDMCQVGSLSDCGNNTSRGDNAQGTPILEQHPRLVCWCFYFLVLLCFSRDMLHRLEKQTILI